MRLSLIACLAVLLQCSLVEPYGSGAPSGACDSMTPNHGQIVQESTPPYKIATNTTQTFGGGRIIVKIESNPDTFMGFFIQARDSTNNAPMGVFFTSVHKTIGCASGTDNAVTHSGPDAKRTVTLEWEAPGDFGGDVTFTATVVKEFTTYWLNVLSPKVTVEKRSVDTRAGAAAPTQPTNTQQSASSAGIGESLQNLYDGCGVTKTCYGMPDNCVSSKRCKFMVTYTNAGNEKFEFELMGRKNGARKYVAVGLSEDTSMGDDSVVNCNNENGVISVYNTWNEGRTNTDGVIDPKEGLTVLQTGEHDGKTYCKFLRDAKTKIKYKEFDLENEKYHILIAEGNLDGNGKLQYHGQDDRLASVRPVSLGQTTNLKSRDTRLLRAIHGSLMIGAWICAASCGILFARYYKQTWVQSKTCNIDQWFHLHRFFMVITWCLTIASFALIIYELMEFRPTTHAIIGIVSVMLCFIQPFMACCRPPPNGKNRSLFNWMHWLVGNAAQTLGITAIFFGFDLFMSGENNWVKEFAWYIVMGFIAFHCLTHIVLSIAQCVSDRKPNEVSDVFPLKEFAGSRTPLQPEEKARDAPLSCLRKFILAIYMLGNFCVTALLILIVVFRREQIENQWEIWNLPAFWEHRN